ncbi:MAG: glycosyltransferase family 4 protein [Deltaproteobacteria bacterium]|nr:glycosyltransferase family 4 protein [Deltaproteobacteria bacterium]MBI3296126.1 glycosyltransferase family 4 protein [Deltaproteobacteria bacterium]
MSPFEIQLDLTPSIRNPQSGIGRTARFTFDALKRVAGEEMITAVARTGDLPRPRRVGRSILHSFEHKLPLTLGLTRVLTVHDLWTLKPNPFQPPEYQRSQGPRLKRAIHCADLIVTPSETVKQALLARFPEKKGRVHAVPHGYQLSPQTTAPPTPAVAHFLSDARPFILCIACLEVRKNLTPLLTALEHLPVRLALIGNLGFGGQEIEARLKAHPRRTHILHLTSAQDADLAALFQACTTYVQPSLDEGFGMPVIDALRFGKRPVLSEIPVFFEIAGGTADYFTPTDASQLTEVLKHNLAHTQDPKPSRTRAQSLTWDRVAHQLLSLYRPKRWPAALRETVPA